MALSPNHSCNQAVSPLSQPGRLSGRKGRSFVFVSFLFYPHLSMPCASHFSSPLSSHKSVWYMLNLNISIFTYVFSLLFLFFISCNRPIWWWCIPHSNQVTSQQIVTFSSIITHKCWLSRWIHFQSTDRSKWAVHTYSICFPSRHHTSNRHITIRKHLLLKW